VLILASSSPQRRAILERLGVPFEVREPHVPELEQGDPEQVARENALRKARAVAAREPDALVLGADTVVALGPVLFGKPQDEVQARAFLEALSDREHVVLGGIALVDRGRERVAVAATAVRFRALEDALLDWYLARGEWRGRAGGYAIQGAGAALVREVRGDYENVVGLPVAALLDLCPQLAA
jgi:septum formation protein